MSRIAQLWINPELRKRLIFTLVMLVIFRLGVHVSVPGVNVENLGKALKSGGGAGFFDVLDLFSGGAFKMFSVFALGIGPYITASIAIQLMGAVIPQLEQLQKKEGEAGRQKINEWTRYLAVILAFVQGLGTATIVLNKHSVELPVVANPDNFRLMAAFTLMVGSIFVMWIGERITERGIGNGTSLLIFAGIVAGLPSALGTLGGLIGKSLTQAKDAQPAGIFILVIAALLVVLLVVVMVESAYRRIPIHYARRADSAGMSSQRSSYMPLKLNTAGVMPVIFASSIISIPDMVYQWTKWDWLGRAAGYVNQRTHLEIYAPVFALLVVFFAFFYTSIVFNPDETAENMKKSGGYIPGIRPGKETSVFMDGVLSKLTFAGAIYLAVVAIVPYFLQNQVTGINFYFGGTSLLIVVGVAMDTVAQLESYQVMRSYDGFMERGRIRGRFGRSRGLA